MYMYCSLTTRFETYIIIEEIHVFTYFKQIGQFVTCFDFNICILTVYGLLRKRLRLRLRLRLQVHCHAYMFIIRPHKRGMLTV